MICKHCKKDKSEGEVRNEKFICNGCIVSGMVDKIKKKKNYDSMIITVMIREIGLNQPVAVGYYNNPEIPIDKLIKAVWTIRFNLYKNKKINRQALFNHIIRNGNSYPPTDEYREYVKSKQSNYNGKDYEVLYKAI